MKIPIDPPIASAPPTIATVKIATDAAKLHAWLVDGYRRQNIDEGSWFDKTPEDHAAWEHLAEKISETFAEATEDLIAEAVLHMRKSNRTAFESIAPKVVPLAKKPRTNPSKKVRRK